MTMRIDFGRRRLAKVVASRATECASCSTTLICIVGHVLYCCRVSPVAFAKKLVVNRHVQNVSVRLRAGGFYGRLVCAVDLGINCYRVTCVPCNVDEEIGS